MRRRQVQTLAVVGLIVLTVLLSLALQPAGAIPGPTPPPAQYVQLEPGGTVYILGDCHMAVDVNGAESLQVTCEAAGK